VKNVLLVHAALHILFLSHAYAGSIHDKVIADATPYPLPDGSELLEDLGFLGYACPACSTRGRPRSQGTPADGATKRFNRAVPRRRIPSEHVISSVKRCRIFKDTIRLRKDGVRDLVMEVCCALHNFRRRLTPWL
jgi:hypothetical protein